MIIRYAYELWNGREVVGYYSSQFKIKGAFLIVPTISVFKQKYGSKVKEIKVPMTTRNIFNNGIDVHIRIVLDVKRKSKNQIRFLMGEK